MNNPGSRNVLGLMYLFVPRLVQERMAEWFTKICKIPYDRLIKEESRN